MLEMAQLALEFVKGMTFEELSADLKTSLAVVRALEVIGEAARHVPQSLRHNHPEIPWLDIAGMRDRLIHGYFGVNPVIVWDTCTRFLPPLIDQLERILQEEFPDAH